MSTKRLTKTVKVVRLNNKPKQNKQPRKARRNRNRRRKNRKNENGNAPPVAVAQKYTSKVARFRAGREGSIVVSHREWIGNVQGSQDFAVTKYKVNPGDEKTFPWLSLTASAFEKYRILRMRLEYIPRSSTLMQGSFLAYADYDVNDETPASDDQMLNQTGAIQNVVWKPTTLHIVPSKFNQTKSYLIRNPYKTYTSTQMLMCDPCNIFVATQGLGDVATIGSLFVTYDVELMVATVDNRIKMYNMDYTWVNPQWQQVGTSGFNVPNLNNATLSLTAGNMVVTPLVDGCGIQFADDFTGVWAVTIQGSGFDYSRPPQFVVDQGICYQETFIVYDEILGTDYWMVSGRMSVPKGTRFIESLGIGTLTNGGYFKLVMGSASVAWWNTVDPKVVDTLTLASKKSQVKENSGPKLIPFGDKRPVPPLKCGMHPVKDKNNYESSELNTDELIQLLRSEDDDC